MDLVSIAAEGEKASAGVAHADNVASSILGGLNIIYSYNPIKVVNFPPPKEIFFALAVPSIEKTTEEARAVLPKNVSLRDLVYNVGGASLTVSALLKGDPKLLGEGLVRDCVVEPERARLFPGYMEAKKAALEAGAYGATLSGAGPSILAVVKNRKMGECVSKVMATSFMEHGIESQSYVTRPTYGAKLIN
jgi:homoserine kinase